MRMKSHKFSADYIERLARADFNSPTYYKILFLLYGKSYTQVQLCKELGINSPQNITKILNQLTKEGFIEVDRVEGRNKFLKAVPNAAPSKSKSDPEQLTIDTIEETQ